eukprot:4938538-Alexandrium_andersonii.AAC.1
MSASLVGSEMCIRDSPCSGPSSASGAPAAGGCRRASWLMVGLRTAVAVSYTHLTLPTICSV